MMLEACGRPVGELESAPLTAVRESSATERWTGHWGSDDRYYASCTTAAGAITWYRFATEVLPDELERTAANPATRALLPVGAEADVESAAPIGRRRTLLFRVGRDASRGCVFGVRRASTRATTRATALRA
jgi:hypothetical protein